MIFEAAKLVQIEKKVDTANAVLGKTLQQQVFTSSGTWTRPAGVEEVTIIAQGGGGGGGGGAGSAPREEKGGGGGDAGGCVVEKRPVSGNLTVTVGAKGASNSGDGGDSIVNTTPEVRAVGGQGGIVGSDIYTFRTVIDRLKRTSVYPGGQNTVLGAINNLRSEAGAGSNSFEGGLGGAQTATITAGGGGASSPFGKGGAGGDASAVGSNATGYGSGGGGGAGDAVSVNDGGEGAPGLVIIQWYE